MNYLKMIIEQVGPPAMVLAAIAYLLKNFISQLMARDIEQLKANHSQELERFKRELEAIQFERQARFTSTHQKRADVIANLYGRIADAYQKIGAMVQPLQFGYADQEKEKLRKIDQRRAAAEALNSMLEFHRVNRIYLGAEAAMQIDELSRQLQEVWIDFDSGEGDLDREARKFRRAAWKGVAEKMPPLMKGLERKFHEILGISD